MISAWFFSHIPEISAINHDGQAKGDEDGSDVGKSVIRNRGHTC